MKTTLDLPEPLMREVRIRAAREGRKLKDLVGELLRCGLDAPPSSPFACQARIEIDPELGIPVVVSPPDVPATRMSVAELLKLEQEALEQQDLQNAGISV